MQMHKITTSLFQSALPRGERHCCFLLCSHGAIFQSALPRGERLHLMLDCGLRRQISIRAPARGATTSGRHSLPKSRFQSALPRGERHLQSIYLSMTSYFNPRSREGSDLIQRVKTGSIHDFNPRSREGSDPSLRIRSSRFKNFNPRSREGSDHGV